MIFELAQDFHDAVAAMPGEHPNHRMLELLEEAIRQDIHFIARHPTTLFQCMWNTCWWYDCPEAAKHYEEPEGGWYPCPPWKRSGSKLHMLVQQWRHGRHHVVGRFPWLRSLRPPRLALGTGQVAVFKGHERDVTSVSLSPDGTRVASGSDDMTVRVWDVVSSRQLHCLRGHESTINAVTYSPDGLRIVSGADDCTIRVWNACTGTQEVCLRGHTGWVNCVGFSPDGLWIVSGSGTIRVWDALSGEPLHKPKDCTVRVWDVRSGEELHRLGEHDYPVTDVAYSSDGERIISGSDYDGIIKVWKVGTGSLLSSEKGVFFRVCCRENGAALRNGQCGTGTWDLYEQEEDTSIFVHSPRGDLVAIVSDEDFTVRVRSTQNGQELYCFRGHQEPVNCIAFSSDGKRIASGSCDETVRLWECPSHPSGLLPDHQVGVNEFCIAPINIRIKCLSFSADGDRLVTGGGDMTARLWDSNNGTQLRCWRHHDVVSATIISPDGTLMASGSGRYDAFDYWKVYVWNIQTGELFRCFEGRYFGQYITCLAFSRDTQFLAAGLSSRSVYIWSLPQNQLHRYIRVENEQPEAIAFSPDGCLLAGAVGDSIRFWDITRRLYPSTISSRTRLRERKDLDDLLDGLRRPSPDEEPELYYTHLLSTCLEVRRFSGQGKFTSGVTFTPNGRCLITESRSEVRVWRVSTGRCLKIYQGSNMHGLSTGLTDDNWRDLVDYPLAKSSDQYPETVVESPSGDTWGWYPDCFDPISMRPGGRAWAGADRNHVQLIMLEGGTAS
jgi:WD40 repeat protein